MDHFFKSLYLVCYNIASVLCSWFFGRKACETLAPQPGIEPAPPVLEGEVLTTGPPGKSLNLSFQCSHCPLTVTPFRIGLSPSILHLSLSFLFSSQTLSTFTFYFNALQQVSLDPAPSVSHLDQVIFQFCTSPTYQYMMVIAALIISSCLNISV